MKAGRERRLGEGSRGRRRKRRRVRGAAVLLHHSALARVKKE